MTKTTISSGEPFELARFSANLIAARTQIQSHDIALTLGSGWGNAVNLLGETTTTLKASEVPGFSPSGVPGHAGEIRSIVMPNG